MKGFCKLPRARDVKTSLMLFACSGYPYPPKITYSFRQE